MSTTVSSSVVDGLVSGLDTTTIISQLLNADASAQTKLKSTVSASNLKVTAFQSVSSKLAAVQSAADALQKAATWTATTASSSNVAITATTDSSAASGSLAVNVTALASGRSVVSTAAFSAADATAATALGYPLDVVSDGKIVGTISPSAGTLSDVAAAINKASSLGIRAVALRVGTDSYRLQITSTSTGAKGGDFKLVPTTGQAAGTAYAGNGTEAAGLTTLSAAADASLTIVGTSNSLAITSPTNTFVNVMPGVSITAAATGTSTVSVAADTGSVVNSVKALIDAANTALDDITLQSRAGIAGADGKVTGGGTLRGDYTLRTLKSQILTAVTSALGSSPTSAATFGVQSTKDGGLTFDQAKFTTAYTANPTAVQKLLSAKSVDSASTDLGLVERLRKVTVGAVGDLKLSGSSSDGSITAAITGQKSTIADLTDRISDWDVRLAQKKDRYQKYYAALETTLGKLQSQSSWLSGQLAGLSSGG